MTIDQLIRDQGFRPEILKIDVEGHEINVLEGDRILLRDFGPLVFLEIHSQRLVLLEQTVDELVRLMEKFRYEFAYTKDNPIPDSRAHLWGEIRQVVYRKKEVA